MTTPIKGKPAGKKKKPTGPRRPDSKKTARKTPQAAPGAAKQAGARPHTADTIDTNPKKNIPAAEKAGVIPAPGAPKKPKDLIQTLVDYADADASGEVVKTEKEEPIDPHALDRGDIPMTVVGHLDELRSRLIISIITIFILTIGAFVFSDEILSYITGPFTDMAKTMASPIKLNVFKLTEGLTIRIKVAAILAILVGLPFLMWQVWRFILPAITKKDRMFSRVSLLAAIILFYAGVLFVFYLLVPFTVKMLISFVPTEMMSTIGANDYISLVFLFCMIMGFLFEMPIIMMLLTRIGILTPSYLVSKRKYAFVLSFVVAAVITPTQDGFTLILVAIPLVILYEASIIVSKFTVVRKKKRELRDLQ